MGFFKSIAKGPLGKAWDNTIGKVDDMLGLNNINQSFNYNPAQTSIDPSNRMLDTAMGNMNTSAGNITGAGNTLMSQAGQTFSQGQSFLDPTSDYYNKQRGFLTTGIANQVNNLTNRTNEALASRGIGSGGIADMLGSVNASQVGEQVSTGMNSMMNQGLSAGTSLMGMGMQGTGQAGSLYNQAGGMYGAVGGLAEGVQSRALNQAQLNAQMQNQQAEFAATGQYNQELGNRTNRAGFVNNVIGAINPFG